MAKDRWIDLHVKALARSITFFTSIGFVPKPGPGNTYKSASFAIGE
jgi:predicted lactoylglutathione lyase